MSVKYEGIIPPIVTPFTETGEIDEEKIRREMEICLEAGADGISVGGSTGEGPTLRDEELIQLIGIAREYVKEGSDKTVVCGVMRTCTRDAVRAGKIAKEAGADAIMVTPTAYNVLVPNAEGMFDFYSTISKEVQLPTIIYNVIPQNTIYPDLFHRLLNETEYIMGIKQSVGGIQALYADLMEVGEKGRVYAATDDMIYSCFDLGAKGAISAILSVFPKESVEMWKCAQTGDHLRGLEIQQSLYKKWQVLGGNQFPIRMKYALKCLGRDCGYCRSPITYLPEEEKEAIRKAFTE
ncbi:dihydrodipicolinate synthase family protein [Blautia sp. MSJ-19]|uniref:dihydrodipicolinate synthase family protein n=1 Tax=Blautia sp. MSJ-19 TaxID=2841517 RepID=UPI001C0F313D|nr:dihydrodipicolinate synthase family protein [Blautia sp. MSJ-19]MBU5480642.1 dihydrodipicolinate synthase family protein [Blautia sp. MSJ-19]